MGALAAEIAVAEEDVLRASVLDVGDHIFHRAYAEAPAEVETFRAEFALHGAAARKHQRKRFERAVLAQIQHVPAGQRQVGDALHLRGLVDSLQLAGRGILQHLRPDRLSLADSNSVAMLGSFFRMEPDVWTTHNYRDALVAELSRYVISPDRMDGPGGNSHQIGLSVEVDVLQLLVNQAHVPTLGCKRCQIGKCERDERAHA